MREARIMLFFLMVVIMSLVASFAYSQSLADQIIEKSKEIELPEDSAEIQEENRRIDEYNKNLKNAKSSFGFRIFIFVMVFIGILTYVFKKWLFYNLGQWWWRFYEGLFKNK